MAVLCLADPDRQHFDAARSGGPTGLPAPSRMLRAAARIAAARNRRDRQPGARPTRGEPMVHVVIDPSDNVQSDLECRDLIGRLTGRVASRVDIAVTLTTQWHGGWLGRRRHTGAERPGVAQRPAASAGSALPPARVLRRGLQADAGSGPAVGPTAPAPAASPTCAPPARNNPLSSARAWPATRPRLSASARSLGSSSWPPRPATACSPTVPGPPAVTP